MTSRSTFLISTALLLTASLAGAATPAATVANPAAGAPAFMAPAATSPGCDKAELPFLNPAPSTKTDGAPCGSCSDSPCVGSTTGSLCGYQSGYYYYCQSVFAKICSTGGVKCTCWGQGGYIIP
jgi:hypothetical protein